MNISSFMRCVIRQDAAALRKFFHPDAVIRWHCSNEQFTVEEYLRANCEYPGDWDGEIETVQNTDDCIIAASRVFPKDRTCSFHVVSFIRLHEDLIIALDEYWADDAPPPLWRRKMAIGKKIR